MAGYRPPYTIAEDKQMLRFILDGDYASVIMGNSIWKRMEKDKVCSERSWQSMKNRFRRTVMLDLGRPEYGLSTIDKEMLYASFNTITRNSRNSHPKLLANKQNSDSECSGDEDRPPKRKNSKKETNPKESVYEPIKPSDKVFYSLDMSSTESDSSATE